MSRFDHLFSEVERQREDMHEYQDKMLVPFLRENPRSAAFVGMGLGKTISFLTLISDLLTDDEIECALVIAPIKVAVQTWPTEIRKWQHTAWLSHSLIRAEDDDPFVLAAVEEATRDARRFEAEKAEELIAASGHTLSRKQALQQVRHDELTSVKYAAQLAAARAKESVRQQRATKRAAIHLINREMLPWLVAFHGRRWPYDAMVIDESRSFADQNTERFKAARKVVDHAPRLARVHLATGTPAPEGLMDLWAQAYLMDKGKRLGKNITAFRKSYFSYNPYQRSYEPLHYAEDEITKRLSDIVIVMEEKDYLDLAEPIMLIRQIKLSKAERSAYNDFVKTLFLSLPDGTQIEAETAAALGQKLLQYASGAVYGNITIEDVETGECRFQRKTYFVHDYKVEELKQIREEAQGTPLFVVYWFKSSLEKLKKAFPKAVVMDKTGKAVDDWNKGKIPMILVHPGNAAHGLNMQYGPGNIMVFFDNPWPLELYMQIIKRLARQGQKKVVRIIHLVTQGTLDEDVVPKLMAKQSAEQSIKDKLKQLWRKARAAQ